MSQSKSKTRDLARLPKAEIHLHLEGAMRPQTLRDLCAKHSVEMPTIPTIGPTTRFRDFSAFVDVYVAACAVLRTEEDVRRLVLETAEDLKRCNVAYAEIAPSLTFYSQYFGSALRSHPPASRGGSEQVTQCQSQSSKQEQANWIQFQTKKS